MKALFQEKSVSIPEGCKVALVDKKFVFEGKLGRQEYDVSKIKFTFEVLEDEILIKSWHCNRFKIQLLNTIYSHIKNHITGVTVGFKFVLRSVYRHFPIQIAINNNGKEVKVLSFIGSKEERTYPVRGETVAMMGEMKDTIVIQGINLNDVSQTASSISTGCFRRKKHDERIFVDGIYIQQKTTMVN